MSVESDNAGVAHKLLLVLGHHVFIESKVGAVFPDVLGFHVSVESNKAGVFPMVLLMLGNYMSVD